LQIGANEEFYTISSNFPGTNGANSWDSTYNGGGDVFLLQMTIPANLSEGTNLFVDGVFRTAAQIRDSAQEFGRGYWVCAANDTASRLTMAISTSNFKPNGVNNVTTAHGTAWGTMVNQVASYLTTFGYASQVTAAGGINAELAWNSKTITSNWITGYDPATTMALYVNADSSGCPQSGASTTSQPCDNGWNQDSLYKLVSEGPALAVPQQYATDGASSRQWQQIALYAKLKYNQTLVFQGELTQELACAARGCVATSRNAPATGWRLLRDALNSNSAPHQNVFWFTDVVWQ
jgi:hypothetical protein